MAHLNPLTGKVSSHLASLVEVKPVPYIPQKRFQTNPSVEQYQELSHSPQCMEVNSLLEKIRQGQLMMVDRRRRNGLILYKQYHAEFAGPGAAVGGNVDLDCQDVLPVGNLLLLEPSNHEERQEAYKIRRQWIRLTNQFTESKVPLKRAQMILKQFESYFDQDTITRVPDEVFAMLVGVLPYSVANARRSRRKRKK
jgi:hypothetical protein